MTEHVRLAVLDRATVPQDAAVDFALDPADTRAIEGYLVLNGPDDPRAAQQATALIDHILTRYHQVHMEDFPQAIALARKVEAVHAADAECPDGLADHLALMADELAGHQRKEETALFPMMRQGGGPMVRIAIARMQVEHRDVVEQLTRLAVITKDFTPPQEACRTWRALNQLCRKLDRELREHMRLEDAILFPHFAGAV
uniref:Hemerythrin HHE cation binding domain protein n=1 Tax=Caulobacter sp. (strain K31) TaxID=366602 RepID=B0SV93_CAUSK